MMVPLAQSTWGLALSKNGYPRIRSSSAVLAIKNVWHSPFSQCLTLMWTACVMSLSLLKVPSTFCTLWGFESFLLTSCIGYGSPLETLQLVPCTWDDAQEETILCSMSGSEKLILMSPSGHGVVCLFDSWRDKLLLRHKVDWQWEMKTSPIGQDRQWSLSEAKSNRTSVALKQGDCEAQLYSAWRYRRTSLRLFFFGMRSYI